MPLPHQRQMTQTGDESHFGTMQSDLRERLGDHDLLRSIASIKKFQEQASKS